MAAALNQDFVTYAGDDVSPVFTVYDSAGAIVNISAVTEITWQAKDTRTGTALLTLTKTGGRIAFVTNGTDGKFQVNLTAANTTTLADGTFYHVASIVAGGAVTTVTVGRLMVNAGWSYNPAKVSTVALFGVRLLIGDTIVDDPQLQDQEILFAISQRTDLYGAAAECAGYIAARFSRKVDTTSPGPISTRYSEQAKQYLALQSKLETSSKSRGGGAFIYAGGISISDKIDVLSDSDRVQPSFVIAMTDNTIPVAQVGNENLTLPAPSAGAQ